jgi:hypothetical protein
MHQGTERYQTIVNQNRNDRGVKGRKNKFHETKRKRNAVSKGKKKGRYSSTNKNNNGAARHGKRETPLGGGKDEA